MHLHQSSLVVALFIVLSGCADGITDLAEPEAGEPEPVAEPEAPGELADWTAATHSNDVAPDLDEVFSDTEVKRIDLVLTAAQWQTMLDDMTDLYGEPGEGAGLPGGGGPMGGGPGGGGVGDFPDEDPVFVPGQVFYDGRQWYNVGLRFKGNSSLMSAWTAGTMKLSFKLDFDEFEDDFPEIKNQRFFGIKKLSLKNNYDDPSLMREKVMADLFADAGLVVSRTGFAEVYVDTGEGPTYFGLYTMVEEVDGSVLTTQFEQDDGNLYKPDGDAASFAAGTFDEDELVKKNNEEEANFGDVAALYDALHDSTRTSDPPAWRSGLDAVFDTEGFLHYLAINTVAQNWDTYGRMTHNYFLYNDPETGRLTWIPWDNNEALQTGKRGGSLALDFSDLDPGQWPLIEHLYADEVYRAVYNAYVEDFIDGVFATETMHARYDAYADLLQPYAAAERPGFTFLATPAAFASGVDDLKAHALLRNGQADGYLQLFAP